MFERHRLDLDAYERRARTGPCFVCGIVARGPDSRYPTQYGYTLVAPKEHKEQVAADFTVEEYLGLQRVVYGVAEAVREEVGAERVYVLSLGSNQGNAHVHWQVVPLPPGTRYDEQQFAAVMLETAGSLGIPEEKKVDLAARIGRRMGGG